MHFKNILIVCGISLSISVAVFFVLNKYYRPYDVIYNENVKRAYNVAEQELLFSDRFLKFFKSSTPTDFVNAAEISRKAVVFIRSDNAEKDNSETENYTQNSSGSGVIISNDGYIITNYHVVEGSRNIEVMLTDNRIFSAKVIGTDLSTDIALLKIEAQNLDFLIFGNSDSLQIGEWVMAVGNPFKLQSTVTAGIVSAKARNINLLENHGIESFIQTDAVVNPGSSGGALINTKGDLVGICVAILSNSGRYEGFSFAIPSNLVRKVMTDLKQYGVVQRGWLGIEIENIDNDMASKLGLSEVSGVLITSAVQNGGASEAGIRNDDVVISINNVKTSNTSEFMEEIGTFRPGDIIDLIYIRDGKKHVTKATLRNQLNTKDFIAIRNDGLLSELGFELRDLDRYEKLVTSSSGVMVVSIKNNSLIAKTRMEPGYIITKVNNKDIGSAAAFVKFLENNKGKTVILEGIYQKYPGEYPYTFEIPKD